MTVWVPRLPLSLDPLVAEAKRRMRKRRLLILVLALLVVGGVAGTTLVLSPSTGLRPAAACAGASAYVYEVPSYPGQAPTAPAWPPGGNDYWGWMVRSNPLKVGNRLRVNGALWRITAIAALPGECRFFGIPGVFSGPGGGSLAGRLILRPVN